jgi:hypothetical protein
MSVIERSDDEIVAEVMDAIPQMKGWREAEIGWRVWTQDAIRRTLALTTDQGAVSVLEWLVSMDDPDDPSGLEARRTVTLTAIIERARAALGGQ